MATLTQLQYIIAVDTHGSFSAAATQCHVTQPTLSMQIQKLEDQLKVILFDRSKHPVKATEIGRKIIDQARVVIQESSRIGEIVSGENDEIAGPFTLGIIPTIASSLLPRFLKSFIKDFPKVNLVIKELQTDEIIQQLSRDQLDAAILATPLDIGSLIERPLYYEPFVAFIPEDHRLSKEKLIPHPELKLEEMLLLSEGHCFRNSVIHLCGMKNLQSNQGQINFESGSFDTLIKLSKQGFGMTLLPYLTSLEINRTADKNLLKQLKDPRPVREVSLVHTRARLKQPIMDALVDSVQQNIPSFLVSNQGNVISPL